MYQLISTKIAPDPYGQVLMFIISRRALAREEDCEMMPVCMCVRVCVS